MRILITFFFLAPFALAILLAYVVGTAMPTHVMVVVAIAVVTVVASYLSRPPRILRLSSRLELPLTLGLLWFVVNTFIVSTTFLAYPIEMQDGTIAWCRTGNMVLATTWTSCCFLSGLSIVLDAARERFHPAGANTIASLGVYPERP